MTSSPGENLEAELARLRSEVAQLRRRDAIFESAIDFAIIVFDPSGIITDWNSGAERTMGWSAAEVIGQDAGRFFTPEDRAIDRPLIEMTTALRDGSAPDERWHIRKDGSRFWASGRMMPLLAEDGHHIGFVKILRDRTLEHETGRMLRTSEDRFRVLLEGVETAFAVVEVKFDADDRPIDYRFLETNPAFERQSGVNLRGKWVTEFAPDLETFWFETYGHVAWTGESANFESYAEAFERWFDVRALRVGDPSERQIAIFFNDVTARKREEAELLTLNDRLEQQVLERTSELGLLWSTSPDLLVVVDFDGVFHRVNPAWTSLLGYQPDELVGHHVNEFVIDEHHTETVNAYTEASEGGAIRVVNRYRHKDGSTRWISWVAAPAADVIYATGRDITAETMQAEVLRKTEDALRQAQKMEAVGQLTGGLAHDFNNLLTGVTGSLEMMQIRIRQERFAELDRYMSGAQEAARRAAALTHRLLAFSRRQTLEPKPTRVNDLVGGMEDLIRRTVGPQVDLSVVGDPAIWTTVVDPNQLENALLNLCINARDAMPEGGRIMIETRNVTLDRHFAQQRDIPAGDYVSLSVSDNGVGMPPDVVERVFEPFFTTKPIGAGTGLGLSMIFGFAKQSGGQVRVHSHVGEGTTVTILLPSAGSTATIGNVPEKTDVVLPAEIARAVLVVDDEPLVRMLIVDVLEELGCTVLEAGDGPQAMAILQSATHLDLLITDVGLPNGMNGRQIADAARATRQGLKVLFVTGYAENAILGDGHLEPGMEVITKPFGIDTLSQRIHVMIEE